MPPAPNRSSSKPTSHREGVDYGRFRTYHLFTCILILVIAIPTLHSLRSRERELGYPKEHETLEDVRFLVGLNEEILAQSCYRRVTGGSLRDAKKYIEALKKNT